MRLDETINNFEQTIEDLLDVVGSQDIPLREHIQLKEWLVQLKQVKDLVQGYADKDEPEKICEENDTCWGWEATTLIGKIADILKIDRCEAYDEEDAER